MFNIFVNMFNIFLIHVLHLTFKMLKLYRQNVENVNVKCWYNKFKTLNHLSGTFFSTSGDLVAVQWRTVAAPGAAAAARNMKHGWERCVRRKARTTRGWRMRTRGDQRRSGGSDGQEMLHGSDFKFYILDLNQPNKQTRIYNLVKFISE